MAYISVAQSEEQSPKKMTEGRIIYRIREDKLACKPSSPEMNS